MGLTSWQYYLLNIINILQISFGVNPRSAIRSPSKYLMFLVDDTIFVRDWQISKTLMHLQEHKNVLGFSLRLGLNTTYCYTLKVKQNPPEGKFLEDNVYKFQWLDAEADFGYPLEVSSSVYSLNKIVPLLLAKKYNNPNELEGQLAISVGRYSKKQDRHNNEEGYRYRDRLHQGADSPWQDP